MYVNNCTEPLVATTKVPRKTPEVDVSAFVFATAAADESMRYLYLCSGSVRRTHAVLPDPSTPGAFHDAWRGRTRRVVHAAHADADRRRPHMREDMYVP